MNPEKVVDRDGDTWKRLENGRYRHPWQGRTYTLADLEIQYGPLTLPDDENTTRVPNADPAPAPLSRLEALRIAREWAREDLPDDDDAHSRADLALKYARYLNEGRRA